MLPSLAYLLHNSTCERPRLLTNFCQEMIHRSKAFCIREAAATIAVPSRQCSLSIALVWKHCVAISRHGLTYLHSNKIGVHKYAHFGILSC